MGQNDRPQNLDGLNLKKNTCQSSGPLKINSSSTKPRFLPGPGPTLATSIHAASGREMQIHVWLRKIGLFDSELLGPALDSTEVN